MTVDHDIVPEDRPDLTGDPLATWDRSGRPEQLKFGQILPHEGAALIKLAANVPSGMVIVELGSYTGKSASCLVYGSTHGQGVPVYAVDLWDRGTSRKGKGFRVYDAERDGVQSASKFHQPRVREIFDRRMKHYDKQMLMHAIVGHSAETAAHFADWFPDVRIGLLFIDAEHTYEAVRADFHAWQPLVAGKKGVIAMHDYAMKPEGAGVTKFVDEYLAGSDCPWRLDKTVMSMAVLRQKSGS